MSRGIALAVLCAWSAAPCAEPRTLIVCPEGEERPDCIEYGGIGIQAAVDAAAPGDTVRLRAGHYSATAYRDVPFGEITVRGFIVIDGKDLGLEGDPGAVLDGTGGVPTTAIVVRNARVAVRDLTIAGFRFDVQEDDIYDGHGIFVIDGRVRADNLVIAKFQKMGLTGRGDTIIEAKDVRIVDGHVGIWMHETAYLKLADSEISRNDSSAIAAYDDAVVHAIHSRFEGNLDDGLFSEHRATIYAVDSKIADNEPYGVRAVGDSTVWLKNCVLEGNRKDTNGRRGRARVRIEKP